MTSMQTWSRPLTVHNHMLHRITMLRVNIHMLLTHSKSRVTMHFVNRLTLVDSSTCSLLSILFIAMMQHCRIVQGHSFMPVKQNSTNLTRSTTYILGSPLSWLLWDMCTLSCGLGAAREASTTTARRTKKTSLSDNCSQANRAWSHEERSRSFPHTNTSQLSC